MKNNNIASVVFFNNIVYSMNLQIIGRGGGVQYFDKFFQIVYEPNDGLNG